MLAVMMNTFVQPCVYYILYQCRGRFEGICSTLWRKCIEPIDVILNKAELHQDAIGHVNYRNLHTSCPFRLKNKKHKAWTVSLLKKRAYTAA